MRALGAVLLVACSAPAVPPPVKVAQINRTGEAVKIEDSAVRGYVTLVDFWSESCAACTVIAEKIDAAIANEARVIVRKVDVGDGFTPIAKAYAISALPHWKVYDTRGRLRFNLIGSDCLRAPQLAQDLLQER